MIRKRRWEGRISPTHQKTFPQKPFPLNPLPEAPPLNPLPKGAGVITQINNKVVTHI